MRTKLVSRAAQIMIIVGVLVMDGMMPRRRGSLVAQGDHPVD